MRAYVAILCLVALHSAQGIRSAIRIQQGTQASALGPNHDIFRYTHRWNFHKIKHRHGVPLLEVPVCVLEEFLATYNEIAGRSECIVGDIVVNTPRSELAKLHLDAKASVSPVSFSATSADDLCVYLMAAHEVLLRVKSKMVMFNPQKPQSCLPQDYERALHAAVHVAQKIVRQRFPHTRQKGVGQHALAQLNRNLQTQRTVNQPVDLSHLPSLTSLRFGGWTQPAKMIPLQKSYLPMTQLMPQTPPASATPSLAVPYHVDPALLRPAAPLSLLEVDASVGGTLPRKRGKHRMEHGALGQPPSQVQHVAPVASHLKVQVSLLPHDVHHPSVIQHAEAQGANSSSSTRNWKALRPFSAVVPTPRQEPVSHSGFKTPPKIEDIPNYETNLHWGHGDKQVDGAMTPFEQAELSMVQPEFVEEGASTVQGHGFNPLSPASYRYLNQRAKNMYAAAGLSHLARERKYQREMSMLAQEHDLRRMGAQQQRLFKLAHASSPAQKALILEQMVASGGSLPIAPIAPKQKPTQAALKPPRQQTPPQAAARPVPRAVRTHTASPPQRIRYVGVVPRKKVEQKPVPTPQPKAQSKPAATTPSPSHPAPSAASPQSPITALPARDYVGNDPFYSNLLNNIESDQITAEFASFLELSSSEGKPRHRRPRHHKRKRRSHNQIVRAVITQLDEGVLKMANVLRDFIMLRQECSHLALHSPQVTVSLKVPPGFEFATRNFVDSCALMKALSGLNPATSGSPGPLALSHDWQFQQMLANLLDVPSNILTSWQKYSARSALPPKGKTATFNATNVCAVWRNNTDVIDRQLTDLHFTTNVHLMLPVQQRMSTPYVTVTANSTLDSCTMITALYKVIAHSEAVAHRHHAVLGEGQKAINTLLSIFTRMTSAVVLCKSLMAVKKPGALRPGSGATFQLPAAPLRPILTLEAHDMLSVCAMAEAMRMVKDHI